MAATGSMRSFCWADTPPPIRISCGLKMCTSPARPWAISSSQASSRASTAASPASAAAKMARPLSSAGSSALARRTSAVVAAQRSQQPREPQPQGSPSSACSRKCPSSPPRPRAPSSSRPPVRMPPPSPVPMVMPMTSVYPFAAPTHASPRHMQLASLATVTGREKARSSVSLMGAPSQPGRLPPVPATMPRLLSICPVADTPMPTGLTLCAARKSAAARSTVVRMGVW